MDQRGLDIRGASGENYRLKGSSLTMTHHTLCQSAVESSLEEGSHMGAGGDDADPVHLSIRGIDKSSFEDETIFFVGYNVTIADGPAQ